MGCCSVPMEYYRWYRHRLVLSVLKNPASAASQHCRGAAQCARDMDTVKAEDAYTEDDATQKSQHKADTMFVTRATARGILWFRFYCGSLCRLWERGGKIGRTIPLDEFPMRLGIGKIEAAAWHCIDSCILRVVESRARQCFAQALRRFNEREGAVTIEAPALNACQRRPDPTGPRSCVCGLALVPLLCRAKRRVAPGVCGRARASQSRRRGILRAARARTGRLDYAKKSCIV
jgi:hypothetical protein